MDERRRTRWGARTVVLLVLPIVVGGCRVAPPAAARLAARDVSPSAPCCERRPVYDLFAAPYRRGER